MENVKNLGLVGKGGFAKVYKSKTMYGETLACKIIPKSKVSKTNFIKEIENMQHLKYHPNIVSFHKAHEDDTNYYIYQEYFPGCSLQTQENLHEYFVQDVIKQTLCALVHMHTLNVIHGDIKPGNILFRKNIEENDVKVCDFGNSYYIPDDQLVMTEQLCGTPCYMSPETINRIIVYPSDIWSLGITAYVLLYQKFPFDDFDNKHTPCVNKIFRSILRDSPLMNTSVSKNANEFIEVCLNKDSKKRPSAIECLQLPWMRNTLCNIL